jgi:hypothetical protein
MTEKLQRALDRRPQWYHEEIATVKNKAWTDSERKQIFNMRVVQGMGIDEILDHFQNRISRVMLFNQIRLARKIMAKRCYRCGTPIPKKSQKPGLLTCNSCRVALSEYKKLMRREYLARKVCGVCWERKAIPGHTACRQCIALMHRRRNKKGLCCKCGEKPIDKENSITLCSGCLEVNRKYARSYTPRKRKTRTWKWTR